MIIRDTIYGSFELPRFLGPLLTSPEFRRLAEVRLININSPALAALADVRRYSHTLGALRIALENPLPNFSEAEYRALLASIIVHDAGTPAFAHLFEYFLQDKFDWDHESVVPAVLQKRHHPDSRSHQFYAAQRPRFSALCAQAGIDFEIVLAILGREHAGSSLIFGSVDFDNIDNVARMNWMLGNRFDVNQMLQLGASLGTNSNHKLLLPETQRDNLRMWAGLRRRAYEILVFDAPTVAGQAVLSTLIDEAVQNRTLAEEDWHYTDAELIATLRASSARAKDILERDFFGSLPEMKLIVQIKDSAHRLLNVSRDAISHLVSQFLLERRVVRPYGYILRDRGTFEKRIVAVDPDSGRDWAEGERSDSLVVYGFGRGGSRKQSAQDLGEEFLIWAERYAC